jgi:hypothetical protein
VRSSGPHQRTTILSRLLPLFRAASVVLSGVSLAAVPAAAQRYDGCHRDHDYHRYDRHRRHNHHDNHSDALAAGALGFILGPAIADSQPHRDYARDHLEDGTWLSHCDSKYRSFDRGSGIYLGYNGNRHYCRQPLLDGPAHTQPAQGHSPPQEPSTYKFGKDFWQGAPADIHHRLEWLDARISRGERDGSITRRVNMSIRSARRVEARLMRRDHGQLSRRDTHYMMLRLNNVSSQIRWARTNGVDQGRR